MIMCGGCFVCNFRYQSSVMIGMGVCKGVYHPYMSIYSKIVHGIVIHTVHALQYVFFSTYVMY